MHRKTLDALVDHNIIVYEFDRMKFVGNPSDPSTKRSVYSISIKNRYKFEQLRTELSQLYDPHSVARTETPNLIYYDTTIGEGTVNGKHIKFNDKSKQKALFELLFAHAQESVPRERVAATLRLGNSQTQTDRLNTAISNLCVKCGVKRDVITVNDSVTLNAIAIPINVSP